MSVKDQFCLRSIPQPLWNWLEDTAHARRQNINEVIVEYLESIRSANPEPLLFEQSPKLITTAPQSIPFRFIDLFAGIGGFRIALNKLGGKCVFTSEWDKFSQKTYHKFYGEMPHGDINEIEPESIPDHDILAAGFPCQPFSIAGVSKKQSLGQAHGFECERQGNLFFKICDIVDVKRPPVLMLENVKNLRSHDKGKTWAVIRQELESRDYIVNAEIVDACHWVPQHRERMIIVCFDKKVFGDSVNFEYPDTSTKIKPKFREILEDKPDDKYILTDHLWNYLQNYAAKHKAKGNGFGFGMTDLDGVSRTISARYYKDGSEILIPRGKGKNPRRLTIVEAARLMGFGELVTTREDMPVSDTQAYKQFGNAVVPAVIKAVGEQVVKVMLEHHRTATNGCFLKGRKEAQVIEVKPVRKRVGKKKPAKRAATGTKVKPRKAAELQRA